MPSMMLQGGSRKHFTAQAPPERLCTDSTLMVAYAKLAVMSKRSDPAQGCRREGRTGDAAPQLEVRRGVHSVCFSSYAGWVGPPHPESVAAVGDDRLGLKHYYADRWRRWLVR